MTGKPLDISRSKIKGYTLVELVIALMIIALIVSIALPSYQESVRKARRSQAQSQLQGFANTAQRFFTEQGTYANAPVPAGSDTVFKHYTFTFTSGPSATGYTIQAAPKSAQASDKCGTMTLDQTGVRTYSGTAADCWGGSASS